MCIRLNGIPVVAHYITLHVPGQGRGDILCIIKGTFKVYWFRRLQMVWVLSCFGFEIGSKKEKMEMRGSSKQKYHSI